MKSRGDSSPRGTHIGLNISHYGRTLAAKSGNRLLGIGAADSDEIYFLICWTVCSCARRTTEIHAFGKVIELPLEFVDRQGVRYIFNLFPLAKTGMIPKQVNNGLLIYRGFKSS